jgi:hypothetical protein
MKKNNLILFAVIALLVIVIAVFLKLNKEDLSHRVNLSEEAEIDLFLEESYLATITYGDIIAFEPQEFIALLKEDGKEASEQTYTGVLLKDLLSSFNIDLNKVESVVVKAVDGYTVVVENQKLIEDDNVYLAYKRNGEFLKTREEGGVGPYQMVISNDPFSQFWCKHVVNIEVREKK